MSTRRIAAAAAALCLIACGDGPGGVTDAGVVFDGGSGAAPATPSAPAPPGLTPCPEGWTERFMGDGPATCEPWPSSGPGPCGVGEAPIPGAGGCLAIGTACPGDGFPAGLPADRAVFYASATASAGGDGSRARPHMRIRDAVDDAAAVRGIAAVAVGRYDEVVNARTAVAVWGACVTETVIVSSFAVGFAGLVQVDVPDFELRNLTIGDAPRAGIVVSGTDASATLVDVIVRETTDVAVMVRDGASLHARSVAVLDTAPSSTGANGRGLVAELGGRVTVERAAIAGSHDLGVFAADRGSAIVLTDTSVADTFSRRSDGRAGRGIAAQGPAEVEVLRSIVERNRDVGIQASEGAALRLSDSLLRDTDSRASDLTSGRGMNVQTGAFAEIARTVIEGNEQTAVYASGMGTMATMEDVVIRDTRPQDLDQSGGRGLVIQSGAVIDIVRAALDRNVEFGVFVSGPMTTLQAIDLSVRDTTTRMDGLNGRGIAVQRGGVADLARVEVTRAADVGLFASEGTVTLADLAVRDVESSGVDGRFGNGLLIQLGADVSVERAAIERTRTSAVLVVGAGARASISDLRATDTRAPACDGVGCSGGGSAVVAAYDAVATIQRFILEGGPECGVLLARDSELDLADGLIAGFELGACVQVEGYDVRRLSNRVEFRDNETNLDATDLPVPTPHEEAVDF